MPDVQSSSDARQVPINKVGVKDIQYPITLFCPATGGVQHTIAIINMYVALPHYQKGTHMSRFLEVLNKYHEAVRSDQIMTICHEMRKRLHAEEAHLELAFPYFIDKKAPVTGHPGKLNVDVSIEASSNEHDDFILGVKVPATSLCPCSREISDFGAHNQRCLIDVKVRMQKGKNIWIEELVQYAERSASTQVFAVLKRPDEKWVTEDAYNNPKFVEDIVRDLSIVLEDDDRIVWYRIESENHESIHNHNAYAMIEKDKRNNQPG